MKKHTTTRLVASTLASALMAGVAAGCNTGSSSGGKAFFGPGSTGAAGGAPGGGGGGGGGLGQFSSAPALTAGARSQHTATTLSDGRVLVVGGTDGNGVYTTSEVFDPVANTWTSLDQISPTPADAQMINNGNATGRQLHTATLLQTNRILIAGGIGVETPNQLTAMTTCYLFDPTTNAFTQTGAMPQGRGWHFASRLSNGHVLVAGGVNTQMLSLNSSATYDPATGQWTASGTSSFHTLGAMVSAGGQTLIVGGCQIGLNQQQQPAITGLPNPIVERYDVQARTFGQGAANVGHRIYYGAAVSSAGRPLFAGGSSTNGVEDTTEYYDTQTSAFVTGPQLNAARDTVEIAEIGGSADMLIIGGVDTQQAPLASCEIYQHTTNTIAGSVNMATPRVDHRVVTLLDGRILVIGGADANGNPLDQCEFYTR